MYTIHIQYALLPNATLPLISLRQNDKKNKLCALNFSLSFMTFIKNNGFYMKILWYILKFPEISGELSGELQPAKKFSSPTPAKSDFLLSAEISGDLLETEISTTLLFYKYDLSPKFCFYKKTMCNGISQERDK